MIKKITLMALLCLTLMSCGSIFNGSKQRITFKTEPPGALIRISGLDVCTTPCSPLVKRDLIKSEVEIIKEGYEKRTIVMERHKNGVMLFNIFNGFLGLFIDEYVGAHKSFNVTTYSIDLENDKIDKK